MGQGLEPFPLIAVSGPPRERGRQYGKAAAARVKRSARIYLDQLHRLLPGERDIDDLIAAVLPRVEAFAPDYVEEMRGIAEGAGLPFGHVLLINARTEIISLAQRRSQPVSEGPVEGCTGAVILPARSVNGRLIHGQNWDWRAECAETAVVLRVAGEGGRPDLLTFTEAGGLARSGFNSAGVAITANYLESDRDYRQEGVPLALIRRKVLEQQHVALAMRAIAITPKSCSNNMIVSQAGGWAMNFECAPDETFAIYPEKDLIVHANHWQSPVALSKLKDTGIAEVPESFYRDWRVRRHLDARGTAITLDDLKEALFDDYGSPYAVCRPRGRAEHDRLSATVAMIIMEPESGFMEIAPLPAENRVFTRYALTEEQALRAAG